MKTRTKWLIAICIAVVPLFLLLRFTGVYGIYRIPTTANKPALSTGDVVYTTNLKSPSKGDFVTYRDTFMNEAEQVFCFRLYAVGGDVIEMKDGLLWVNNRLVDDPDKIVFSYALSYRDFMRYQMDIADAGYEYQQSIDSTYRLYLTGAEKKKWEQSHPVIKAALDDTLMPPIVFAAKNASWTCDNFGPLTVPKGKWLLLGDNRHAAYDSRYLNFADENNFVGTVLNY